MSRKSRLLRFLNGKRLLSQLVFVIVVVTSMFSALIRKRRIDFQKCLNQSGFEWREHVTNFTDSMMSMPQFTEKPSGFAARANMVVGSRATSHGIVPPNVAWVQTGSKMEVIFVRTDKIQTFYHRVLPCIRNRFVLITGDTDKTTPRQVDLRSGKNLNPEVWKRLHLDNRVIHHFAENLDTRSQDVTPLPVGINAHEFPNENPDYIVEFIRTDIQYDNRPLKVLQIDRIRTGEQWDERKEVRRLCSEWAFCESKSSQKGKPFFFVLQQYSFVLCPHGGGLDPSPKAWEAIAMGAIPIIKHFEGDDCYMKLPVVFIDSWTNVTVNPGALWQWKEKLRPWYTEEGRLEVLKRLRASYWWQKVMDSLHGKVCDDASMSIEWRDYPKYEKES
ncbi:hypothetical protein M9435_006747 [Picochlorum sp. BPE23]|nr:hypothetical protein M9435_006747 [Picochlorum sp. BPE23]